jgi:hypothetical protein
MELEIIMLNETSQAHKHKYHFFSHMWNGREEKDMKVRSGL